MTFKFWHVKTNGFWLVQSMGAWSAFPSITGVEQIVQGQCAGNRGVAAKSQAQCQFSPVKLQSCFKPRLFWLPPTLVMLQLCCSSSCAWSCTSLISALTWLHFLVWHGTCLKLLPRPLLGLVTVSGLDLPGLCSFPPSPAVPFCSVTHSREGLHKFTEESPVYSTAAACSKTWCLSFTSVNSSNTLSQTSAHGSLCCVPAVSTVVPGNG